MERFKCVALSVCENLVLNFLKLFSGLHLFCWKYSTSAWSDLCNPSASNSVYDKLLLWPIRFQGFKYIGIHGKMSWFQQRIIKNR